MFRSPCFWAALTAWTVAQFTKMLVGFHRTHRIDIGYLVRTGGMPSAHSATVTGLATSVGISLGFGDPVFILALAFALLTMFDASTVRRAAGMQAKLLNEMIQELFKEHHLSERKLVEFLGHARLEVFMGMVIGVLIGILVHSVGTWV